MIKKKEWVPSLAKENPNLKTCEYWRIEVLKYSLIKDYFKL